MPDESCRKCGSSLKEYVVCAECREVNQYICKVCGHKTETQFHDGYCFIKPHHSEYKINLGHTALTEIIFK